MKPKSKSSAITAFNDKIALRSVIVDACVVDNPTPELARIAAMDYKLNGSRARTSIGDFIGPRWVPDPETSNCSSCSTIFDWANRRHHCRHCGKIFCGKCTNYKSLLPKNFGLRDPQRVCQACNDILAPHQRFLTNDIANHQRANPVHLSEESCDTRRYFNLPYSKTMGSEIRKAAYSVFNLASSSWIRDSSIPASLISNARGLAFFTIFKVGLGFSVRAGTGILISRLSDGRWSGPVSLGVVGMGWGAAAGLEVVDCIVPLNSLEAVQAFSSRAKISIGVAGDLSVGPLGRSANATIGIGDGGLAVAFSYSHSRGLFAGLAVEGGLLFSRPTVNYMFYGQRVDVNEVLRGQIPPPKAASPLYDALRDAEASAPSVEYSPVRYPVPTSDFAIDEDDVALEAYQSSYQHGSLLAQYNRSSGVNGRGDGEDSRASSGWRTYPMPYPSTDRVKRALFAESDGVADLEV